MANEVLKYKKKKKTKKVYLLPAFSILRVAVILLKWWI